MVDFVRALPPDEAEAVGTNSTTKQGYGTAHAGAAGRKILSVEVGKECDPLPNQGSDVYGQDELPGRGRLPKGIDG